MLWDAEATDGFASTAKRLALFLRVAATLGFVAAAVSLASSLPYTGVHADSGLTGLVNFAHVAVVAFVVCLFFRWFATACAIAREVSAEEFEFFPHGAIASFFIPLVNLVLPYRIVVAMCDTSLRACGQDDGRDEMPAGGRRVVSGLENGHDVVDFWWTSVLATLFVFLVVVTADGSPLAPALTVAADLALGCAAIGALRLVRLITDAQLLRVDTGA